jgi:hypothetical protein
VSKDNSNIAFCVGQNPTTDDLPEGNNRLYFTTMRARAAISAQKTQKDSDVIRYDKQTGHIHYLGDKKLEARVNELEKKLNYMQEVLKLHGIDEA